MSHGNSRRSWLFVIWLGVSAIVSLIVAVEAVRFLSRNGTLVSGQSRIAEFLFLMGILFAALFAIGLFVLRLRFQNVEGVMTLVDLPSRRSRETNDA